MNDLAPDTSFIRPRGWCVAVPCNDWADAGDWAINGVLELLQPDAWHSWSIWPHTPTKQRVPVLNSARWHDWAKGREYLRDHPACEWMLFNEPDMPGTALPVETAVELTLQFINEAREIGEEFQVMSPNVTIDTEHDGLGWLTEYMSIMRRKKGYMRPSSWGIHPYTCNSVARLRQSMGKWWDWYEVWGSDAPTIITEVCAEDSSVAIQKDVMIECAAMLARKEVLGVAWASAYLSAWDGVPWEHYPLCTLHHDTQTVSLTDLGRQWKELQNGLE